MKKIVSAFALLVTSLFLFNSANAGSAAGNYTVGVGPVGNIFVVDSGPELDPGIGGYVFFDYRWSPQFSTQFSFIVTTQDGTGASNGDNSILFFGVPSFDLKFYLLSGDSRWDPYGFLGVGFYFLSEGSADNGSAAYGMGANVGLGVDYYLSEKFSLGLAAAFRSIGLIDSVGGSHNGTAEFPLSLMANFAYHW